MGVSSDLVKQFLKVRTAYEAMRQKKAEREAIKLNGSGKDNENNQSSPKELLAHG